MPRLAKDEEKAALFAEVRLANVYGHVRNLTDLLNEETYRSPLPINLIDRRFPIL